LQLCLAEAVIFPGVEQKVEDDIRKVVSCTCRHACKVGQSSHYVTALQRLPQLPLPPHNVILIFGSPGGVPVAVATLLAAFFARCPTSGRACEGIAAAFAAQPVRRRW
jgi:hypothetical protein